MNDFNSISFVTIIYFPFGQGLTHVVPSKAYGDEQLVHLSKLSLSWQVLHVELQFLHSLLTLSGT